MKKTEYQIIFEERASILVQALSPEDAVAKAKLNRSHGISIVDNNPGRPTRIYVVEK